MKKSIKARLGGKKMEIINIHNIFEFNQQYNSRQLSYYEALFIDDFSYLLRQSHERLIKFSNPKNKEIIVEEYFENKLIDVINSALMQLLFEGKSYFAILESSNYTNNKEDFNNKLVICNLLANRISKGIINFSFYNDKTKRYKIGKEHVVEIKLNEVGYMTKFFIRPIKILDINHEFLMSDGFIYSNINNKKVYAENDIKQILITKDIYWDCRKSDNDKISLPYLYYRKEKFYNMRVRIFKYIIDKINKSLSKISKIDFDYIKISNEVCAMDLYSKYINNEISLKDLQDNYYKNTKI